MKKKMNLSLLIPLAFLLNACGGESSGDAQSANPSNEQSLTYRVAIEPTYPPFVMQSPQGLEGFDVDLLNAIAEKEGFKVSYTPTLWSKLFDSLPQNEADIIAGGLTVVEERKSFMDFTDPYYENSVVLLVTKDSPIHSFDDAKGKRIAYQQNTSSVNVLKSQFGEPNAKFGFDSPWLAVKSVIKNEADAAIGDSGAFNYYASQYKNENLRMVYATHLSKEPNAFAVKKGNTELLTKLNKGLAALKADGSYDKIYQKWISNKFDAPPVAASSSNQ